MDNNNIGVIDVSYIDSQSELLVSLINKSKTEKEKIEYAKDTLTAIATKYFLKGIVANSKHNNELTYIDKRYPPLDVCKGTPGTDDRTTKPMGQE
jgi:hypothetical protein